MIAALCEQIGPAENLILRELPDPAPGPGEVLVAPTRVALNFFDTLIIANKYQIKPDLPFSPGGEFCGRVLALGAGVEALGRETESPAIVPMAPHARASSFRGKPVACAGGFERTNPRLVFSLPMARRFTR